MHRVSVESSEPEAITKTRSREKGLSTKKGKKEKIWQD